MFKDKNILITGATGGLGRRVALQLADGGARTILASRNLDGLNDVCREIVSQSGPGSASPIEIQFDDNLSTSTFVERLPTVSDSLDGVVLIYPSVPKSPIPATSSEQWRTALNLCFVNPLTVLNAAITQLQSSGRIVVVSGIAGVQVFPTLTYSNVIRSAWLAHVKTLSFHLAKQDIRINTLSLGGTLTERFSERLLSHASVAPPEDHPDNIPLGRYGDADDAAHAILILLSRFTNHMTGANIVIDGGLTRRY